VARQIESVTTRAYTGSSLRLARSPRVPHWLRRLQPVRIFLRAAKSSIPIQGLARTILMRDLLAFVSKDFLSVLRGSKWRVAASLFGFDCCYARRRAHNTTPDFAKFRYEREGVPYPLGFLQGYGF
jgi:hypothetical protein